MTTLVWLTVAVVVAGFSGMTAAPTAAGGHASPDIVEVSSADAPYARDYRGLFDGRVLVPREPAEDAFDVRNAGDSLGYLRIALADVDIPDRDVLDALTIVVAASGRPGVPAAVATAKPCRILLSDVPVRPGQTVRVDVGLMLGDLAGTNGQNSSIRFRLQVLLSQSAEQGSERCPTGDRASESSLHDLPATGLSTAGVGGVAAALVLAGVGALALQRRRRADSRGKAG
jgi:LPXTG-motif cell wall-anchored protein